MVASDASSSLHLSERSFSVEASIQSGIEFLARYGMQPQFFQTGGIVRTTRCEIQGRPVGISAGMGKGFGEQSKASALFEAIEHIWWYSEDTTRFPVEPLDLNGKDSSLDKGSPDLRRLTNGRTVPLTRACFQNLRLPEVNLHFPYFLTNPFFVSRDPLEREAASLGYFSRYGSNSGTAAGCSIADAQLHALLEVVERDAIGIELLKTVIKREAAPVRRLLPSCFSPKMKIILDQMESEGLTFEVWDFTTEIGIPVILASVRSGGANGVRHFGSGASLSFDYAIERAVLEAVQCVHALKLGGSSVATSGIVNDETLPLTRCNFDQGNFGYRGGQVDVESLTPCPTADCLNTEDQVAFIINALEETVGMSAHSRIILEDIVCIVQIVVPRLERFHLVTTGVPVLPGYRGRKVLNA